MDKNSKRQLLAVVLLGIVAFIIPHPKFQELKHVSGKVIYSRAKDSSGVFLKLQLKDKGNVLFSIPNSTEDNNAIVLELSKGDYVDVWYDDNYTLGGSFDCWQLSIKDKIIISYDKQISANKSGIQILAFLTALFFVIFVINFIKYRIKYKKTSL